MAQTITHADGTVYKVELRQFLRPSQPQRWLVTSKYGRFHVYGHSEQEAVNKARAEYAKVMERLAETDTIDLLDYVET